MNYEEAKRLKKVIERKYQLKLDIYDVMKNMRQLVNNNRTVNYIIKGKYIYAVQECETENTVKIVKIERK